MRLVFGLLVTLVIATVVGLGTTWLTLSRGTAFGALPIGVAERVAAVVREQWGEGLIRSWNDAGWYDLPMRVGDRIAPQTTRIVNGVIEANYADRKPGEPFTTAPSVGTTKHARVTDGKLVEVR